MAQKTISISLGKGETEALRHALSVAQGRSIDSVGRKDATLTRIEEKIVKAQGAADVKAAPADPETEEARADDGQFDT